MPQNGRSDVVIRSCSSTNGTDFIVVCAGSSRLIAGPFEGMTDALRFAAAHASSARSRILYEAHDQRGRAIGERIALRAATHADSA